MLLDKARKKTRFLTQAIYQLELDNIAVVTSRVEDYQASQCFDSIICRAFSSIRNFIHNSRHLCCNNGRWLAMKAAQYQDELADLECEYSVHDLTVPGLSAERKLISIENRRK